MSLRWYAADPARRARQLGVDAFVAVFALACVLAGRAVHEAVARLAAPGRRLQDGAGGLADSLRGAGRTASDLPLVGDELSGPLDGAGASADQVAQAGTSLVSAAEGLADLLGVVVALLPVALVLALWLPPRLRFARRAGAAQRFLAAGAGEDLLALRALASQPLARLARVSPDPLADWRRGDPTAVTRLAALERRSLGLPPGEPPGEPPAQAVRTR